MSENPFNTPVSGQADWDSGLGLNFQAIDRGYHFLERAGTAISTGQILWLNSGGFFFPFNPASASILPHAYAYTAAASGDSIYALAWGVVRSLGVNSPLISGEAAYVGSAGFAVGSYAGETRQIGVGLDGGGILFSPKGVGGAGGGVTMLSSLSDVSVSSVTSGQVPTWSGSHWANANPPTGSGGGVTMLSSLSDVSVTSVTSGQVPTWSGSFWVNANPPTGGSGGGGSGGDGIDLVAVPSASLFPTIINGDSVIPPPSVTDTAYGMLFNSSHTVNGDTIRACMKAIANATVFSVTVGMRMTMASMPYRSCGLFLSDGTKSFGIHHQNGVIQATKYSSYTSYAGNSSFTIPFTSDRVYFRVKGDGTYLTFQCSADGRNFLTIHREGLTDFLGTITMVGIGSDVNNTGTVPDDGAENIYADVFYWNE